MQKVDEKIDLHIEAIDREKFVAKALNKHEQRQEKTLKELKEAIDKIGAGLDEAKYKILAIQNELSEQFE